MFISITLCLAFFEWVVHTQWCGVMRRNRSGRNDGLMSGHGFCFSNARRCGVLHDLKASAYTEKALTFTSPRKIAIPFRPKKKVSFISSLSQAVAINQLFLCGRMIFIAFLSSRIRSTLTAVGEINKGGHQTRTVIRFACPPPVHKILAETLGSLWY